MTHARRSRIEKKRTLFVLLVRFIRLAAGLLPYRWSVAAGGALGRMAYALLHRERERALAGLRTAFPERDDQWVRCTARSSFIHLGKSLLEAVAIRPGRFRREVSIQGIENLQAALAQGRGVVYVTGHIGNWELMAGAVARSFPLSVVAAPLKPDAMNDMIVSLRAGLGARTIIRSRPGAAKELIRVFRENRILGILIDQDTDVEGVFVDFFGRPAWTPAAAAQMAIRFKAPVIYGHIRRGQDGRHTVIIEGPIELTQSGNEERDSKALTAKLTNQIERTIREAPEQWVWMHRRWRRQP